ncbi:hypothetical protein [Lysinibacillus fusiformis]
MITVKLWSFTMDYETSEIVMNAIVDDKNIQLRACKKDIKSMQD